MAWRDSRRNRTRLLLFISSIVIGIAALVAINSFGENLQKDIDREAKSLLGADLELETNIAPADSTLAMLDSLGGQQARTTNFASMAYFPKSGDTRLAFIRALEGNYPFYGKISTNPVDAQHAFRKGQKALVDHSMMLQYGLKPGDEIKIGQVSFEIAGEVLGSPGSTGIASTVAPVVFIPMQYLEQTGLVKLGSRVEYQFFYKFDESVDVEKKVEEIRPRLRAVSFRDDTVKERKEDLGNAFSDLTTFLNLVSFIALLLGCIGVASSVHIYIKDKLSTVAILRCLGASGRQAFQIYLLQVVFMGLLGSLLGVLLGSILQLALPFVLQDFLPLERVSTDLSFSAILNGAITGLSIAVLFALLPLISIRNVSPLSALRSAFESTSKKRDPWRWLIIGLIFLFVFGFTYFQTGGGTDAFIFPIAIGIAFLILAGIARLVMWGVRRFFPTSWSYLWRQSLANLYRPNNQTLILIVSIGLGTALLSTLFFTRDLLLDQVESTGSGDRPNMILFDIQTPQKEAVAQLTSKHELPLLQQVPIVTMRLESLEDITKAMRLADTTSEVSRWVYNREYRVTYRDTLIDTEKILEGEWHGDKPADGSVYISIADNLARAMKAEIGTKAVFNVQGTLIETTISSIREVDFNRVQTNFLVVFPTEVLEKAPQFHVVVTKTANAEQSARFQRAVVKAYPNVSILDLSLILKTIDSILSKVSFVIQFMALFSILTGLLVLISSIILSKYQRIRESVLLRTIGASRQQILWINALEYFLLGALATFTGLLLSILGAWLLARFQFEIPFTPNWLQPLWIFLAITGLTVLIGLFNSREVLNKPPLEVLRSEV